ncbi:MAG: MopE-related protein [Bacteroidota bacterium]
MKLISYLSLIGLLLCISIRLSAQFTQQTFEYNSQINIPDGGAGIPYPANLNVSGLPAHLSHIRLSLYSLEHIWTTAQFDLLLEAPNGERIVILSDVSPDGGFDGFSELQLDADAPFPISSENYYDQRPNFLPTNVGEMDIFPILDTIIQAVPTFASLQNTNPNGDWKLYVRDDVTDIFGGYLGRWAITIEASNTPVCPRPDAYPEIGYVNRNTAKLFWTDAPGTNWDIFYTPVDQYAPEDTIYGYDTPPSIENVTGSALVLDNLDYDTHYALYLRTDCNGDNQQVSRWQGPIYFTTESGICAYAEDLSLCGEARFGSDTDRVFFDPCSPDNYRDQQMFNFQPPADGDYYFSILEPNPQANYHLSSISINAQEVVDYCDSIDWRCIPFTDEADILLPNLSSDTVYKLLLFADDGYSNFVFKISTCPMIREVELEDYVAHVFDVDLVFEMGGAPLVGNYDVYYTPRATNPPSPQTTPSMPNLALTDGRFRTPPMGLEADTDYDVYLRQVCTDSETCWVGPFDFSTERYCGEVDLSILTVRTTATTAWLAYPGSNDNRPSLIVFRDSLFEQPDYADPATTTNVSGGFSSIGTNIFLSRLEANTTYYYYLKMSCSGVWGSDSQAWQGPFSFQTNSDCFVEVENLYCGQCYRTEVGPREDENVPFYSTGRADIFPGNNPQSCTNLDFDPQLERIFVYRALEDGTLYLDPGQMGTCSGSFGSREYLNQFYYKSASQPCDLDDWSYLGCWSHKGFGYNDTYFDDISLPVKKDSSYYIMMDFYGSYCNNTNPSVWMTVEGNNCKNPCEPVENLTATPDGTGHFTISWDAVDGVLGYDILPGSAHQNVHTLAACTSDYGINLSGTAIHPDTFMVFNVDSILANLNGDYPYSIYVRTRCAEDNFSVWREVSVTPEIGERSYHRANRLGPCSPSYDRTTISPLNGVSYDVLPFSVDVSGIFRFQVSAFAQEGVYVGVYEGSFDENNPSQNLYFETSNSSIQYLNFDLILDHDQPYFLVANRIAPVAYNTNIDVEVDGPAELRTAGFRHNGLHEGPRGIVPPTNGQFYQSNKMCRDTSGWQHYYYEDPNNPNADPLLILSLEDYEKASLSTIGDIAFSGGSPGTSLITNPPADYVQDPDGWITMNRYWDLNMPFSLQPDEPVAVRFYYTEADLQALRNDTGMPALAHEDLNFYKINDPNDDYNLDPSRGHRNVPSAPNCADEGLWEYFNAEQADTILWTYGTYNGAHYAEMLVHSFSGGGGAVGSYRILEDVDGDGFNNVFDCNDNNSAVNPNATEVPYDGWDNDCNPATLDDDLDGDGFALAEDCDDADPLLNPAAAEIPYDGIDNDCNPMTYDDDVDQDGFVLAEDCDDDNPEVNANAVEIPYDGLDNDCNPMTPDDDLDGDGFVLAEDCDDDRADINPNATEIPYDNIDNDCNAATLDDDFDQDGFAAAEDCNDDVFEINPGAAEIPYDGEDNDCNPATPDDDLDGDGFLVAEDCNDNDPNINANAVEIPYDGEDNDCDAMTPDDDLDGDGFVLAEDCDDNRADINPNSLEVPYDGIDNDCNPITPDDDLDGDGFVLAEDCDDDRSDINPNAAEIPYDGEDNDCDVTTPDDDLDGDGFGLAEDCNDEVFEINPNATEIPYDGEDNDCNELTPDDDLDGDGFVLAEDCDDDLASVNPNQQEIVYDGLDNDCNPLTLDDDLDEDGFVLAEDCNDDNPEINPDATEIPGNGLDENCDGLDIITSVQSLEQLSVLIYPNPTEAALFVELPNSDLVQLSLYDGQGRLLETEAFQNQLKLDLGIYPAGVYLVLVQSERGYFTERVVRY